MPDTRFPFEMAGGVPVVTAPPEFDASSAGQLQDILLEWQLRGHTTVVVDMSGTRLCDPAGLTELARAHQRARAHGGALQLVVPADGAVLPVLRAASLDRFIPHHSTREQALAQVTPVVTRPPRPERPAEPPLAPPRPATRGHDPAADNRSCEQCGELFVPQREHARFCSADCRAAWNREHMGDPAVEASALSWSITALNEATARLPEVKVWDQPRALAAITEAVWWITMVDATLVRHHPGAYAAVIAAQPTADRQLTDQTLAGLRFARNWMSRQGGLGELIDTSGTGPGRRRVTGWTWKSVPEPQLTWLPPRAQAWEIARHRAYQACLAGHTVGQTFSRATAFLARAGESAASATDASSPGPA